MYKCIQDFSLQKYDDNGLPIENKYVGVIKDSIWNVQDSKDYRFIDGEIRLEDEEGTWIEISKETLKEYFEILEADCLACPYSKVNACADCCKDWENEEEE